MRFPAQRTHGDAVSGAAWRPPGWLRSRSRDPRGLLLGGGRETTAVARSEAPRPGNCICTVGAGGGPRHEWGRLDNGPAGRLAGRIPVLPVLMAFVLCTSTTEYGWLVAGAV